jgi:NTP pyrophosphatase (non-canonical NTP hydrolase)
MDFNSYQRIAKSTAIYPSKYRLFYPALGLSGEVGELNNKIKKRIRDSTALDKEDIKAELGDILWYLSAVATDMDIKLDDVAACNIKKLRSRKARGTLKGSGDRR